MRVSLTNEVAALYNALRPTYSLSHGERIIAFAKIIIQNVAKRLLPKLSHVLQIIALHVIDDFNWYGKQLRARA